MKKRDLIFYVEKLGINLDILKQVGKTYRKMFKDKILETNKFIKVQNK